LQHLAVAKDSEIDAPKDSAVSAACPIDEPMAEVNATQTLDTISLSRASNMETSTPQRVAQVSSLSPSEPLMDGVRFDNPASQDHASVEWAIGSVEGGSAQDSIDEISDNDSICETRSDSYIEGLDAMGVIQSTTDSVTGRPRRPSGYFGPSSTVSLLGDAFSAIKNRIRGPDSMPSDGWDFNAVEVRDEISYDQCGPQHNMGNYGNSGRSKASPFSGLDYIVPTRAEADQLVDSYSTWVYSLYPFVHMPSFLVRYESIWTSAKQREQSNIRGTQYQNPTTYYSLVSESLFHCMLNLVFAMGALFNPAIALSKRDGVSRTFFNRAKALLDIDALACGSTALVQVLLLMGQYLQSTDAASSCWNMVGLAIRVSQGIGLHHEPECCRGAECAEGSHSQLEREIRRRTWTCAVVLDR
jgi:hypothetical protein